MGIDLSAFHYNVLAVTSHLRAVLQKKTRKDIFPVSVVCKMDMADSVFGCKENKPQLYSAETVEDNLHALS